MTVANAKRFIADRLVDEAKRQGVDLTDVEVRMLGFAEASASSEDMEVAAVFERDYDDMEYESKIAKLLRCVYKRDIESGMKPDWDRFFEDIAEEDMYLFVMLERAGIQRSSPFSLFSDWRFYWGLVPTILLVATGMVVAFSQFAARFIPNGFLRLGLALVLLLAPLFMSKMGSSRAD